jgi:hypothetical protein
MLSSRFVTAAAWVVVLSLLPGCGSKGPAPVTGKVLLEGVPLPNVRAIFSPIGEGRPANGVTDAEGVFSLTTVRPGDGAFPGKYKVIIQQYDPDADAKLQLLMDPKLDPRQREKLMADQKKKAPMDPGIHANYKRNDKTPFEVEIPPTAPIELKLLKSGG